MWSEVLLQFVPVAVRSYQLLGHVLAVALRHQRLTFGVGGVVALRHQRLLGVGEIVSRRHQRLTLRVDQVVGVDQIEYISVKEAPPLAPCPNAA